MIKLVGVATLVPCEDDDRLTTLNRFKHFLSPSRYVSSTYAPRSELKSGPIYSISFAEKRAYTTRTSGRWYISSHSARLVGMTKCACGTSTNVTRVSHLELLVMITAASRSLHTLRLNLKPPRPRQSISPAPVCKARGRTALVALRRVSELSAISRPLQIARQRMILFRTRKSCRLASTCYMKHAHRLG